jgi:prevent-host-death family protein
MNKHNRVWSLQDAKAKFSEVVRRAQTEGPQIVTVHGKEAVTITATEKAKGKAKKLTGADLVEALRSYPGPELKIPRRMKASRFRDVEL